jgi:antitoxin VapB
MALSIKNEDTERLARQVARETGESLTEAIQKALQERWERLRMRRRNHILASQVEDLLRRVDSLPTVDSRSDDEILGYDEHGTPR